MVQLERSMPVAKRGRKKNAEDVYRSVCFGEIAANVLLSRNADRLVNKEMTAK